LKHKIALEEEGMLQPRFSGLDGGGMKRNVTHGSATKNEAGGAGGASSAVASSGVGTMYHSSSTTPRPCITQAGRNA
jgi:hypothetical protein